MASASARSIPILALVSSVVWSCSSAPDDPSVRERDGYLEFRDRAAFDDTLRELAAKSPGEQARWEAALGPFRSARALHDQAVEETVSAAESGAATAGWRPSVVTANADLFVLDANDHLGLNLPLSPHGLERVVDRRGVVKIGASIFQYRRDSIKEIVDGDVSKLAALDRITESSRAEHVMVYKIDTRTVPLGRPTSRTAPAGFAGNSNQCVGYTGGGGQRVIGNAQVSLYITTDIYGYLGYPGEVVCDTSVDLFSTNQNHTIFGWFDKPTAQLVISGVVYMYSPVVPDGPTPVYVSDGNTVTFISTTLFDSGWIPCDWLPSTGYPMDISGHLDYYGRDGSYCGMYGEGRDHFYTTNAYERDYAMTNYGYQSQGVAAYIYSFQAAGTTPLYRLLGVDGRHFYTIYSGERDNAIAVYHYTSEGVAGYVYSYQAPGTTALYRLADGPYGGTEHLYTTDAGTRDYDIERYGFVSEGVAAYVYDYQAAGTTPLHELAK